jgi:hypothetical protein
MGAADIDDKNLHARYLCKNRTRSQRAVRLSRSQPAVSGMHPSAAAGMTFDALATDFDSRLAHDGIVDPVTVQALGRHAGLKLLMVTGREQSDLFNTFDHG